MIFKRGFTLIELLVVIAIIGILATIILNATSGARGSGRDGKRISEIRQIRYALELYYNTNGIYPCALYSGGACAAVLAGSPGMSSVPKDPAGVNYTYVGLGNGTNCTGYHLGVALEDKNNQVLRSDSDAGSTGSVCTNSAANFTGLSNVSVGSLCNASAGTAQPSGTETCYDASQ